ncbi:hypothetical protein LTR53_014056 [Teratosphaeriaceae sp. CCFEE 6253]|nr:hypothetical protein LTR53_014056 [Teratosphaeriaceae sp. CCFEE 6253]
MPSCAGARFYIDVKRHRRQVHRLVRAKDTTIVPPHSVFPIQVNYGTPLPEGRDYSFSRDLFMPTTDRMPAGIYGMHYVVNAGVRAVFVRNESDSPMEIPAGRRVGTLHEFDFHGAYLAREADHGLTALNPNAAIVNPTLESRHDNGATLVTANAP